MPPLSPDSSRGDTRRGIERRQPVGACKIHATRRAGERAHVADGAVEEDVEDAVPEARVERRQALATVGERVDGEEAVTGDVDDRGRLGTDGVGAGREGRLP